MLQKKEASNSAKVNEKYLIPAVNRSVSVVFKYYIKTFSATPKKNKRGQLRKLFDHPVFLGIQISHASGLS